MEGTPTFVSTPPIWSKIFRASCKITIFCKSELINFQWMKISAQKFVIIFGQLLRTPAGLVFYCLPLWARFQFVFKYAWHQSSSTDWPSKGCQEFLFFLDSNNAVLKMLVLLPPPAWGSVAKLCHVPLLYVYSQEKIYVWTVLVPLII